MTEDVFIRTIERVYRPPSDFAMGLRASKLKITNSYIYSEPPKSAAAAINVMIHALYEGHQRGIVFPYYGDLSRSEAELVLESKQNYPHVGPKATNYLLRLAEASTENGTNWGICLVLSTKFPVVHHDQTVQHIPLLFQDRTVCIDLFFCSFHVLCLLLLRCVALWGMRKMVCTRI